ncbi:uncharacterized protein LOC117581072 [Drosophila guanche]|uniref:DRBM domain-containing protein n=1 Tax=Drosophila guanche TaxID=7266 RepID=A0A3B0JEM0_DROGU|nr:uncharacterized protein LOC117581072 [Drosophila guanche]XP_034123841.1 uncharacterized protein LOC117581072 [Drosophila guanche]SPP78632.1 Hypothetical predicted protein [Drosophila guanche]
MTQKFVMSFLNEFCVKTNWPMPEYEVLSKTDGFLCHLKLKDVQAVGEGASKKNAKQAAALHMWKQILQIPVIREVLEQADSSALMSTSRGTLFGEISSLSIKQRRKLHELILDVSNHIRAEPDFSMPKSIPKAIPKDIQTNIPKPIPAPILESIQRPNPGRVQAQLPEVKLNLIELPYPDDEPVKKPLKTPPLESKMKKINEIPLRPEPCYRYIKLGNNSNIMKIRTSDHNYFKKFPTELKEAAFKVINSKDFPSEKEQAEALLAALELSYTMELVPSKNPSDPVVSVELHCDYLGLFLDFKRNIYSHIIDYLKDMLV